ncbi:14298_t:CDS:1 [Funneliformis mosseae]|uniref:14298_t:CDS:1 n=1 Tax=Funneliformis mosseae TaxID=27381 RepID=A0A9N9FYL9_FUNMO|nr:14298_t:CDS:1 [Funneliformis mosseae]
MFQENNDITVYVLAPSSPSSTSSFSHEYDTSNFFSRLPNETIFAIFAFTLTDRTTTFATSAANEPNSTTTSTIVCSPHKQIAILSRVCRLFHKIANDVFIWQMAFEKIFDSEAIIRAGIIENYNRLEEGGVEGVDIIGDTKGEGEGKTTSQVQPSSSSSVQTQTGGNIWKELYKERQIALNKVKNYITPTLPSPFVSINYHIENDDDTTTTSIDDLMECNFNCILEDNADEDDTFTNDEDSSTLKSTDQVDDNVDVPLIDFNFVGNQEHEEQTEEKYPNSSDLTLGDDDDFLFQEFDLEDTTGDAVEKDATKENDAKIDLEDNAISTIKVEDISQDIDFVGEDPITFDDPELDSIFASNIIEMDQIFNDVKDGKTIARHTETLVKDTDNSTNEVDNVFDQNQDLFNSEIKDDLDETYLQDYYESSKLPDYEDESSQLQDYDVETSKLEELKLPDSEELSSNLPDLEEDPSSNLHDLEEQPSSNFPDLEEEEPSSNFQDEELKLLDHEIPLSKLQDHEDPKLPDIEEPSPKLQDYEEEFKLPDHEEESFKLPDYDEDLKESINDDLPAYDENEVFQLQDYDEDKKLTNLQDFNNNKTEIASNVVVLNEQENDLPAYDENDGVEDEVKSVNLQNEDVAFGNGNNDILDDVLDSNMNDSGNNHEDDDDDTIQQYYEYDTSQDVDDEIVELYYGSNEDEGYQGSDIQSRRIRMGFTRQNNNPELLKILNTIWKICKENDGMNSEVLLASNVKEFTVSLIQALDKTNTQIDCLSIALQVLSILMAWHPELAIGLQKMDTFWSNIHASMIIPDIFFPESTDNDVRLKHLYLPASAGSAIHIFFRIKYVNSNRTESIYNFSPPPPIVPNSKIFNNLYQKPGDEIIQPYNDDEYDGKWFGYYSDFQPLPYQYWEGVTQESAMDITLKFSPPEPGKVCNLSAYYYFNPSALVTDKVVKEFSGSGTDQVGEFIIKKGVITEKGKVNFIKTYVASHSWIYDGVLLPVGICGRWGRANNWGGNFWIWKR